MEFNDFFIRLISYIKRYIRDYTYDVKDFMIHIDSSKCPAYSISEWNFSFPIPTIQCIENIDECCCEPMQNCVKLSLEDRVKQLEDKIIVMQAVIDTLTN